VTTTSFGITLYGQCCQLHVVGQLVVSDISVIRSCWTLCSLHFEYDNTYLLLCLLTDVLGTSILLQIPNIAWPTTWRILRIQNLVTSLHLIYGDNSNNSDRIEYSSKSQWSYVL